MIISQFEVEKIISLAKLYGVTRLILFGSTAKTHIEVRDIDLACDGVKGWKLYEFGAKLENELGVSIDIVPLNPPTHFTRYIQTKGKVIL